MERYTSRIGDHVAELLDAAAANPWRSPLIFRIVGPRDYSTPFGLPDRCACPRGHIAHRHDGLIRPPYGRCIRRPDRAALGDLSFGFFGFFGLFALGAGAFPISSPACRIGRLSSSLLELGATRGNLFDSWSVAFSRGLRVLRCSVNPDRSLPMDLRLIFR